MGKIINNSLTNSIIQIIALTCNSVKFRAMVMKYRNYLKKLAEPGI